MALTKYLFKKMSSILKGNEVLDFIFLRKNYFDQGSWITLLHFDDDLTVTANNILFGKN